MKKFFDCSINELSNSLHNKESMGPLENDMMIDLGKYANYHGWERIYNYKQADLIITNGFYTDDILEWSNKNSIARIKRMDGIYYQNTFEYKNVIYNKAAKESNHVIFISHYSKDSLNILYKFVPNNYTIVLNNVDDAIFYPIKHKNSNFSLITSASNWSRETKRFKNLLDLSKIIDKDDVINVIGRCDYDVPINMIKHGYIEDQHRMNNIIANSDIFVSLFFRDAGSKVTCQGVNCKLPILYSDTGGLPELVKTNGIAIREKDNLGFLDTIPELDIIDMLNKYKLIKKYYKDIVNNYKKREKYQDTLSEYFKIMNIYV